MYWIIWALLAAFFAGLTAVLAKAGVENVNSNLATAVRTTVVVVFAWAVAFATNPANAVVGISKRAWIFLVLSGLATGVSWLCYFRALQLGEASKVAPIDKLSVVFVVLFAALFLGEIPTARTLLGIALIVAGAVVLAWPSVARS
jgi:transporter family protein